MPKHGGGWTPHAIRRFVRAYESSSEVTRVETELGEGYMKALGNKEGPHVLACELVGTALADWLGLPTLDYAIIEVTSDDEIPLASGRLAQPGRAFITRAEDGFPWGGDPRTLVHLQNQGDLAKLVILDTWIRNCDRHRPPPSKRVNVDNVFLSRSADGPSWLLLKAIDHTHAFTCGNQLTRRIAEIDSIRDETVYGSFPEFTEFLRADDIAECGNQLQRMNTAVARLAVDEVPSEWDVSKDVRAAWVEFIVRRADFVVTSVVPRLVASDDVV